MLTPVCRASSFRYRTPLSSTPTSSGRSSPNPFPRKSQDRTLSDPTSARPSNLSFTTLRHDGDEKVIDSEEASEVGDGDGAGSKANGVDLSYLKIPESYDGDGDAEGRDQVGVLYRRQSAPNAPVILRMHSSEPTLPIFFFPFLFFPLHTFPSRRPFGCHAHCGIHHLGRSRCQFPTRFPL